MQRHDGEDLVNRPGVRQRLEDAEVAVVDVGEHGFEYFGFGEGVRVAVGDFLDFRHDDHEDLFDLRAGAQVKLAAHEAVARFVAVVHGVVEAFLYGFVGEHAVAFHEVVHEVGGFFVDVGRQRGVAEAGDVQDVEHQHGGVGDGGAPGFGDDGRMLDAFFVEHALDGFDHVHAVFFEGVVARVDGRCPAAVVIDRQAAAEVKEAHRRAFFDEFDVVAAGFAHAGADVADVGAL